MSFIMGLQLVLQIQFHIVVGYFPAFAFRSSCTMSISYLLLVRWHSVAIHISHLFRCRCSQTEGDECTKTAWQPRTRWVTVMLTINPTLCPCVSADPL